MCGKKPQDLNDRWLRIERSILQYASSLSQNKMISNILSQYNSDQTAGKVLHDFALSPILAYMYTHQMVPQNAP